MVNPEQSKLNKPVHMANLRKIPLGDPDLTTHLNEVLETNKLEQRNNSFWFPTHENPDKVEDHTSIQTRILTEILELKEEGKLNPQEDVESRTKVLERFGWTATLLTVAKQGTAEGILVDYYDIFAIHSEEIVMNTEYSLRLTLKDNEAVYNQIVRLPIHQIGDLIVDVALMHKYGIDTVQCFSKYASPILAQRKPNGKLRLPVDLKKINSLIADDYKNNKHTVTILSDAAKHLAGMSFFCNLDCSQAFSCLQVADQWSVEMLAFNFATKAFD